MQVINDNHQLGFSITQLHLTSLVVLIRLIMIARMCVSVCNYEN